MVGEKSVGAIICMVVYISLGEQSKDLDINMNQNMF